MTNPVSDEHARDRGDSGAGYFDQDALWEPSHYEASEAERLRARATASLIDPSTGSVLDVGCGSGFVTRHIVAAGCVIGLDYSEAALQRVDFPAVRGSIEHLPFASGAFDAAVCTEVLEHLPDARLAAAAAELARVARQVLVVGVPYREDLRNDTGRCRDCRRRYHLYGHCRSFPSVDSLTRHFPDFAANAVVLIGRRQEIASRLYKSLRWAAIGPRATSPFGVCPVCGSKRTTEGRTGLLRRLFDGLDWRVRTVEASRWMVVRMCRRDDARPASKPLPGTTSA